MMSNDPLISCIYNAATIAYKLRADATTSSLDVEGTLIKRVPLNVSNFLMTAVLPIPDRHDNLSHTSVRGLNNASHDFLMFLDSLIHIYNSMFFGT